jgi:two-component system nitrate/nitrite response regulator NarL
MGKQMTTIVVEPRSLVREALVSLMTSHSHRVVGSFGSTADIESTVTAKDAPRLVILGALAADEAASSAGSIRRLWPHTKIVLLFDHASSADFQKLLASGIDGCIPLLASPDMLMGALQQIVSADLRVLIFNTGTSAVPCATGWREESDGVSLAPGNPVRDDDPESGIAARTTSLRIPHGLSQREEEILKSVVRGHSNKMIARTCGVTDATIKVHMKSILRKIRVANRTQAAIWALEQGYGADANSASPVLRPQQGLAAA